jgi:hypothetical protein
MEALNNQKLVLEISKKINNMIWETMSSQTSASSLSLTRDQYSWSLITASQFQAWVKYIKLPLLKFISWSKFFFKNTLFLSYFLNFSFFFLEFKTYLFSSIYEINGHNFSLYQLNSSITNTEQLNGMQMIVALFQVTLLYSFTFTVISAHTFLI